MSKKTTLSFFTIIAFICALLLAFISVTSLYQGEGGELPGLLQIEKFDDSGLLKSYRAILEEATDMPRYSEPIKIIPVILTLLSRFFAGVIFFIEVALSPVMLIAVAFMLIFNLSRKKKDKNFSSELIAWTAALTVFSQSYHFTYRFMGLEHQNNFQLRIAAFTILLFSTLVIGECTDANKEEKSLSRSHKATMLIITAMAIYSMLALVPLVPPTRIMRIFFGFSFSQIIALYFCEALHFYDLESSGLLHLNFFIAQLFFVLFALCQGEAELQAIAKPLIINLVFLIVSQFVKYRLSQKIVTYPIRTSNVLQGRCSGTPMKKSQNYKEGIPHGASKYFKKNILVALILFAASLLISILTRFLLHDVFGAGKTFTIVIQFICLFVFSCFYFSCVYDDYLDPYYYIREQWKGRSSVVCTAFSIAFSIIPLAVSIAVIFLFDLSFKPSESLSIITYSLLPAIILLITMAALTFWEIYTSSCSVCGYLNTYLVTDTSSKRYYKRHIREIPAHYVTDTTTATSTSRTEGGGYTDHYVNGIREGRSYSSDNATTTTKTTYETQRFVEAQRIDEGNFEHTITYSKYRCHCCGHRYSGTQETSEFVGF